jgi:hypothetical protein
MGDSSILAVPVVLGGVSLLAAVLAQVESRLLDERE